MRSGVGRSGSPMPSEMTSMPCAFFKPTLRSISANRYGGRFAMRLAVLTTGMSLRRSRLDPGTARAVRSVAHSSTASPRRARRAERRLVLVGDVPDSLEDLFSGAGHEHALPLRPLDAQ